MNDNLNKIHNEMTDILNAESINVDDIISNGVSLRIGGKVLNLVVSDTSVLVEDEIRNELYNKLKVKLTSLSNFIDTKMSEAFSVVSSLQLEFQRKEKILNDKLLKSNPMPDISWDQAQRGLSVIPAPGGGIGWLVRRTYWPKFVDDCLINPKYQKKMITPIIIYIDTESEIIRQITVRNTTNLEIFDQYHRNCWGNWNWSKLRVTSAEDAITIADQAISVLEKINTMSVARRTPSGLPRLDTLRRNLMDTPNVVDTVTDDVVSRNQSRSGVDVGTVEDVWAVATET